MRTTRLFGAFVLFAAMLIPGTAIAAPGDVTVVGGTGVYGFSGDGGPATSAKFRFPRGIAIDAAGNIYIADSSNHRVRRIDPNGIITTVAGTGATRYNGDNMPATSANLYYPIDVAVDDAGNLYIADTLHHRIRRVDPAGIITTVAGGTTYALNDGGPASLGGLYLPYGLDVGQDGNLYIADTYHHRIRRVGPDGIITTVVGGGSQALTPGAGSLGVRLYLPMDVAADVDGNLFLVEYYRKHIIEVLAADGTIGTVVPIAGSPSQISLDVDGNVFFVDREGTNSLSRLDTTTGEVQALASLDDGLGSTIGNDGHAYITSYRGNRVYRVEDGMIIGGIFNEPPVADAGAYAPVECTGPNGTAVLLDGSNSYDADGDAISYSWSGPFSGPVGGMTPQVVLKKGSHTITLMVEDSQGGSDMDTASIWVRDTVPPHMDPLSDVWLEATSLSGAVYSVADGVTAADNCGPVTLLVSPGGPYPMGETVVTVTAQDTAGLTTSNQMAVTVRDTTPPVLTVPDDLLDVPATGADTTVDIGTATAIDIFPVGITNDAPDTFPVGVTEVTWTAIDANGNVATAVQKVSVVYTFGSFLPPLTPGGVYRGGRTLPVKFTVGYLDGTPVDAVTATLRVTGPNGVEELLDDGEFRYSASDLLYIYNLRTGRHYVGIYRLTVELDDGSSHSIDVEFR